MEKSGFQKNFEKILTENFKPLYTNKKVQLQLDFLISPAVAGLFLLVIKSPATAGLLISPAVAEIFD